VTTEDTGVAIPATLEDLTGRTPDELRDMIEVLDAHLKSLHQTEDGELRSLTEDEQAAFDLGLEIRERAMEMLEEHRRVSEIFRRRPEAVKRVYVSLREGLGEGDIRRLTHAEARDRALRILDSRDASGHLSDAAKDRVNRLVRLDTDTARRVIVTENEHYRNAFMKLVTMPDGIIHLDDDERNAIKQYAEYRAMGEVTPSAGGYGIPVFIDPSIILTDQESGNPFLQIARQVTVNTNEWKGVSAAGVTWAFQTEAAQVADGSVTLDQPTVRVHMARGFIPYSIEVGQDYPMFADEMSRLLREGYDELLVDKFTRGSGTGEPRGILTALSANTNVRVVVDTAGAIGSGDPYKVWKALPQKYRRRASWLMSVGVNNAIRQLGAANVFHGYTVNLPQGWADQLFDRAVYESPYMPDTTTSTSATDGLAVVGDFQNYVIARRGGMSVELVQHLFQQTTAGAGVGMPTGQRGWFAYARIGGDSVNDLAFRLLVNK